MKKEEREKKISKQPIPTKEECLEFYKQLAEFADARFVPYYKMAIKAIKQEFVIGEIKAEINSPNRGTCDYFIVDRIEEIINKYKAESEVE